MLERAKASSAALDLDWLCRFDAPGLDHARSRRVL